jgi:hypothetical protein
MLPAFTTNVLLQLARKAEKTCVTPSSELPSQEAQSSRSPPLGSDGALKECTWQEVLSRGLKTLYPHREVKSVVIYIYYFALHRIIFL